jgi:anaerobic C4-dicarboxylate transporter
MINHEYLVETARPPSDVKRYVNHHVIPAAIDAAGSVEAVLEILSQRTRRQPAMVLGVAAGAGFLLSVLTGRRRPQLGRS